MLDFRQGAAILADFTALRMLFVRTASMEKLGSLTVIGPADMPLNHGINEGCTP